MNKNTSSSGSALTMYIAKNMIIGVLLAVFVIILVKIVIGLVGPSRVDQTALPQREDIVHPKPVEITSVEAQKKQHASAGSGGHTSEAVQDSRKVKSGHTQAGHAQSAVMDGGLSHSSKVDQAAPEKSAKIDSEPVQDSHAKRSAQEKAVDPKAATKHGESSRSSEIIAAAALHADQAETQKKAHPQATDSGGQSIEKSATKIVPGHEDTQAHATPDHEHVEAEQQTFPMVGMAFVDAVARPLEYELTQRFYGWRPNDILDFTDNVNNFQLGVLEVTRRSAVILSERISRTGSTAAFDKNLQNAMNWFMIKSDRYWFPSAESKYKDGLTELRTYFKRLEKGEAQFYNRTDNLIPLLMAYQDLLGSCDENLVKFKEDDGSIVSYFRADDYFFYAQGVASALHTILRGIEKDFVTMVDRRGGMEMLHHAIESCHHAMELDPWIVLNSDLSSVFANHRLNMAGPISHARFYLGVLIRALST